MCECVLDMQIDWPKAERRRKWKSKADEQLASRAEMPSTCNGLLSRASRKQQQRIRLQNENKRNSSSSSSRSVCLTRLESDLVQQQHVTTTTLFWQQLKSLHWQKSLAFCHAALRSLLTAASCLLPVGWYYLVRRQCKCLITYMPIDHAHCW